MENYFWLLPIIFIVHDMEEIVGMGVWLRSNKDTIVKRFPFIAKTYKDFSTEGFALAVTEELLLCVALSAAAVYLDIDIIRYLWLGTFTGCVLHFLIHIGQSVIMRKYIPAVATSALLLPPGVYIIFRCFPVTGINARLVFCCLTGMALVGVNLVFALKLIGWFTRKTGLPSIM